MSAVVNDRGRRLFFDPRDARGVRLGDSGGNVNPDSLRLWGVALGLDDWDVVVDVGSNYGEMIVGAELPASAEVVGFEPNPAVLPYLHRTLDGFARPVDLVEAAVGDRASTAAAFEADRIWSGTSKLRSAEEPSRGDAADELLVPVVTLTETFRDRDFRSACIKVDVEGGEVAVLRGAADWLAGLDRWAMMIEILHMTEWQVAALARAHHLFLFDTRVGHLIPMSTTNPAVVRRLLASDWLYRQDALLLSSPKLGTNT